MKKSANLIYKIFSILSIICMLWAIETTLVAPRIGKIFSIYRAEHSYKIIILLNIFCFVFSGIIICATKFFMSKKDKRKDISNKQAYFILLLELCLYSLLTILLIKFIGFVNPVDDTRITLEYLSKLEQGKQFGFDYMYSNPQNLLLMYVFMGLRVLFGSNYFVVIVFFILLHCLTIFFTFLSLKNINLSNKVSLLVIQILFFALQITLHVPVAYTDVFSLFFISISLFSFSNYLTKKNINNEGFINRKPFIYLILTSFFAAVGFLSKGTVLIFVIAISCYLFFSEKKIRKFLSMFPLLFLFLINLGWNEFIQQERIFQDGNYGQPNTHYIMMGLNNTPIPEKLSSQQKYGWIVGAYNSDDQAFSWDLFLKQKLPKKDVQKKQLSVAFQRWNKMSLRGKMSALNTKVAVTWSSGDLKSSFEWELGVDKTKNRLHYFTDNITGTILYCWMMVIQYIVYIGIILSTMKYFNNKNSIVFFCNIFITGYFCFLLIWESSPRYAMGIFIPAIVMIGLYINNRKIDNS